MLSALFLHVFESSWICCLFADWILFEWPCSDFPFFPLRAWQRKEVSCSQLWHTANITMSSSAHQQYCFHRSSLGLLGLPGMLQRSSTGQQSLSRLRGNRSHSLSAQIGSGREQLGMRVLHTAALRPQSSTQLCGHTVHWELVNEGKQLCSVTTEGGASPI